MKKNIVIEALNNPKGNINYLKELTELSRKNRNNPTQAESKIWNEVLKQNKTGFRFLRQKPINRFILDFYCSELNIAIEIDGASHNKKKKYDIERDKFLHQIGIETIRFTNNEVLNDIKKIKDKLKVSLVKGRFRGIKKL